MTNVRMDTVQLTSCRLEQQRSMDDTLGQFQGVVVFRKESPKNKSRKLS